MATLIISFIASAVICAAALAILASALPSHFLSAQKNERSNHTAAARQLGGIALIPAALITLSVFSNAVGIDFRLLICLQVSALLLWITGFLDDRYDLPVVPRLAAQLAAAALAAYGLGTDIRLLPDVIPTAVEFGLIAFALLVWINITNFMDGLDLMTASGLGLPLLAVAVLALLGLTDLQNGALAASLSGAVLGFALFNRPPARIFLGDSGSLPLGLLAGVTFLLLARQTSIMIAVLLPLYYLLDAGSTLIMRAMAGENIMAAHSRHAYQIAKRSGRTVLSVIASVARLNVFLALCALTALLSSSSLWHSIALLAGLAATVWQIWIFRKSV